MPRAGWCRECGEWVWVDAKGACRNGHGPDCVTGIYDAREQEIDDAEPTADRGFGSGEMPPELDRFNWGALLLPSIWGIVYGVWPVVTLWLLGLSTPVILMAIVGVAGPTAVSSAAVGISVVSQIIGITISLYIGASATRMLWRREQLRLEVLGVPARFSVEKYRARQKVWTRVGVVFLVFSLFGLGIIGLGSDDVANQVRAQLQVGPWDAAIASVWLAAEIGLGLWLSAQMRKGERA